MSIEIDFHYCTLIELFNILLLQGFSETKAYRDMLSRQLALHDFNKFNENPRMSEMG